MRPSKLRCISCHKEFSSGETCPDCNQPLARICAFCGFANSPAKHYCDMCGETLALKPEEAAPAKAASETSQVQPAAAPPAGNGFRFWYGFAAVAAFGALAAFGYTLLAPNLPKYALVRTAKRYLGEFSSGNYDKVYNMLSRLSQDSCSREEFVRLSSNPKPWQFRNVEVFFMDKDAAMVKYQLKEGTNSWTNDYVSFIKENGRWARPYTWNMYAKIDSALESGDKAQALFLAQRMFLTDPLDPRSHGYLCATEYGMGLYQEAIASCSKAIKSGGMYPVGYSIDALAGFRFQLADSYRSSGQLGEALNEFAEILALSGIKDDMRCAVYATRSHAHVEAKNYESALADVLSAQNFCKEPDTRREADGYLKILTGEAKDSAIELAKNYKASPGDEPFSAVWRVQKEEMSARLRLRQPPEDSWTALHVAGPVYRVVLRMEKAVDRTGRRLAPKEAFSFTVDVWNNTAEPEERGTAK